MYDLGAPNYKFKDLYLSGNSLHIGGVTINRAGDGVLDIPIARINGVNPGAITIRGTVQYPNQLLQYTNADSGDGYIIGTHLWVAADFLPTKIEQWVDVGEIKGPMGFPGPTGPMGSLDGLSDDTLQKLNAMIDFLNNNPDLLSVINSKAPLNNPNFTGRVNIKSVPQYNTNIEAIYDGLISGDLYRTGGVIKVVI